MEHNKEREVIDTKTYLMMQATLATPLMSAEDATYANVATMAILQADAILAANNLTPPDIVASGPVTQPGAKAGKEKGRVSAAGFCF